MEIKRRNQTLEERAEQEYANSIAITNAANIEYIAMMSICGSTYFFIIYISSN